MKLTTVQKAYLALITANVIWGAASPIFKLSLEHIPPYTLAFWRFFIASLILLPYALMQKPVRFKEKKDLLLLLGYAFSGITINILFFFWGIQRTYALNGPIIASSAPIVTMVFAMLLLREKFRLRKFLGIICGSIGILTIVLEPLLSKGLGGTVAGNSLLFVAMLGAVGSMIVGRALFRRYNPLTLTFWIFTVGWASFLPLAVYDAVSIPNLYRSLHPLAYLGIIYGGFFSSALAYACLNWGLSKIPATDSSLFTYIDPVVGTVLATILLHEPVTKLFLLGTVLIFGGIYAAEGRLHYHPFGKLRQASPSLPLAPPQVRVIPKREAAAALERIFSK
ncbi:DMT family transporter [Patescibacteria group bacterium]|nr:DMT family transporter [Patescibacteria group bacterium]